MGFDNNIELELTSYNLNELVWEITDFDDIRNPLENSSSTTIVTNIGLDIKNEK